MLTTDPGRWTFTAAGATGSFNVNASVFDTAAIALYGVDAATSAIYTPTYTVALAADRSGAVITVSAGMTLGDKIIAYRVPKLTQVQPLTSSGPFPAKVVERQMDRAFADIQGLYEMVKRSVRFPLADDLAAAELPIAAQRSNKPLGFDGTGAISVLAGLPSVPVSVAMEPVVTAATIAAARTALGFSAFFQTLIGSASDAALMVAGGLIGPAAPVGRLSLATGVPVMGSAAYTGKTVVYWTPHGGLCRAPVWDGTRFATVTFPEISNDLTSAAANVGAAAAQPYSCYDFYLLASGALYRSPRWRKAQTFTVTLASPGVFTTAGSHGFYEAQPVFLETTGTLPTGLAALTPYFIHVVSGTTFNVATSLANLLAGTYVNTSVSQTGVHTVATFVQERGTGAGTAELELLAGIHVNKFAMTNGPAARFGTYVGTGVTDASSQLNWNIGGFATGGTEALLHLWNAYNRVPVEGIVGDLTDNWNYTTALWRPARGVATMRVSFVLGLREDPISAEYSAVATNTGGGTGVQAAVGFNATAAFTGTAVATGGPANNLLAPKGCATTQAMGLAYLIALENSQASGTTTYYGDGGGVVAQSGLLYKGKF